MATKPSEKRNGPRANGPATRAEMLKRVARFDELQVDSGNYLDDAVPGHIRVAMKLIGGTEHKDPLQRSPLPPEEFTVGLQAAATGNGPGLHAHATVEVFMVLDGEWVVYWIDAEGEGEVTLGRWDVISVPPNIWRGARHVADERGLLLAIRGGADGGGISWHPRAIEEAARYGRTLDEQGRVVVADPS